MKTYLYRASNLKSTVSFITEVNLWHPLKTVASCDLFIIIIIIIIIIIFIIIINFFGLVFSECTLETILPEICAFIIGFSCTV